MTKGARQRFLAAGALALAGALFAGPATAAPPSEWVFASVAPEGSPTAQVMDDIARAIERAAHGRLRIRARHGGVVADEVTTLGLVKQGRIQMWAGSIGAISELVPAVSVLEAPFLFTSVAALAPATRASVLGTPRVARAFREQGLQLWSVAFIGWRALSSVRPIRLPADLTGMRVRTQPAPIHRAMWARLGVKSTETHLNEVLAAFRSKTVEVADLPALYVFATSITDHVRYHTRTEHMMQVGAIVFNREAFGALPRKVQGEILALAAEYGQKTSQVHEKLEAELIAALRERVTVLSLTADERAAWRRALAPVRADALRAAGPAGAELLRSLEAATGRFSAAAP
jgi:C4-dicarboxylate-binding protein DctP